MAIYLLDNLGSGRLDSLLRIFAEIRETKRNFIQLNWTNVKNISPAGYGILACLFDSALEQGVELENTFVKKNFKSLPVVKNLLEIASYRKMPKPSVHDFEVDDFVLQGQENALNPVFIQRFEEKFGNLLGEEMTYSCQLILNELMQNSVDHSSSERYYMYGGLWNVKEKREIHIGVLDMGVSIPAKLAQKYREISDQDYLDLALKEGSTTRRARPGGLGLYLTFEHLKQSDGTLTVVSRHAQLVRYFKSKTVRRRKLKFSLNGTWCFARFPLVEEK